MTDEPRFQRVEGGADTLHLRYHGGGIVAVVLWLADLWISARGGTPAHRSASIAAAAQTSVRRARAWALVSAVLMAGIVALITASGLKDTSPVETNLPPPPTVTGGLDHLLASLRQTYGFYYHD